MRADEKQVDGPDLEREQDKETLVEQEEHELLPDAGEQVRDLSQAKGTELLSAMRMILEKQQLSVSSLRLPQREAKALEALQAAVSGRTANTDRFVYAEDRRSMLEQALAVLQPNLAGGDRELQAELHEQMAKLTKKVAEVRTDLQNLQDAQDELTANEVRANKGEAGDQDDKPTPVDVDPDAPKPKTSLTGPELAAIAKPPSSLAGPDLEEPPTPPSTLGDPAEIAEAQKKKPWWRRPFGADR